MRENLPYIVYIPHGTSNADGESLHVPFLNSLIRRRSNQNCPLLRPFWNLARTGYGLNGELLPNRILRA